MKGLAWLGPAAQSGDSLVKIFVEGGGDKKNPDARRRLRVGFGKLLQRAEIYPLPEVIACGGRSDAFQEFKRVVGGESPVMLLVDSESAVSPENSDHPWAHLAEQENDGWKKPKGARDDDVCLMVRCMEAWILADPKALAEHYEIGHDEDELQKLDGLSVESVSPSVAVKRHLNFVADKGGRSKYHKTRDGFALIGKIDPFRLEKSSPHAKRFFKILRDKLGSQKNK